MRTGILLSVREKATRFPGKVLKPLDGGSVTEFLIRRLRQSVLADRVVLATSGDPRDAVLVEIAQGAGIDAFRGSCDDKLLRYRDACRAFDLDFVVIVDGDDPFASVEHIDRLIESHRAAPADYLVFANLPLGATGFGLAASALETICTGRREQDTEIWGSLFLDDDRFDCRQLSEPDPLLARPEIRMTLDYEADYHFFLATLRQVRRTSTTSSFREIMQVLADCPDLAEINRDAHARHQSGQAAQVAIPQVATPAGNS